MDEAITHPQSDHHARLRDPAADQYEERSTDQAQGPESLLSWSLPLNLGVLESFFFVRHIFRRGIGQSAEERVQAQVAIAHLAVGVLGLLSIRFRGMFWFATVIGQAIFLIGIAALNVRELFKDKMFLFDGLMSLAHLGLLKAYDPLEAARSHPVRRR